MTKDSTLISFNVLQKFFSFISFPLITRHLNGYDGYDLSRSTDFTYSAILSTYCVYDTADRLKAIDYDYDYFQFSETHYDYVFVCER